MNQKWRNICIIILGWLFIFLGIIGLFLPLLQGVLFLIVGLLLLSGTSPWAKRLLDKARERFPNLIGKAEAIVEKFKWKKPPEE